MNKKLVLFLKVQDSSIGSFGADRTFMMLRITLVSFIDLINLSLSRPEHFYFFHRLFIV